METIQSERSGPRYLRRRQRMAEARRQKMTTSRRGGILVINLDNLEIWDNGDLYLLREKIESLAPDVDCWALGLEMLNVKYLASGFFDMLCLWQEKNPEQAVVLFSPHENVRQMVWFQQFFDETDEGYYQLRSAPKYDLNELDQTEAWVWDECASEESAFSLSTIN